MSRLLIVHHTPSPSMQAMLESVVSGADHEDIEDIEGVEVAVRRALSATAVGVLEADGYLLGTPANLGYMAAQLSPGDRGVRFQLLSTDRLGVQPR